MEVYTIKMEVNSILIIYGRTKKLFKNISFEQSDPRFLPLNSTLCIKRDETGIYFEIIEPWDK